MDPFEYKIMELCILDSGVVLTVHQLEMYCQELMPNIQGGLEEPSYLAKKLYGRVTSSLLDRSNSVNVFMFMVGANG